MAEVGPKARDRAEGSQAPDPAEDATAMVGVFDAPSPGRWYAVLGAILLVTLWTRMRHLEEPAAVCWDEAHFGKFANWYIKREFFFDVHPPLGKMAIAAAGYLTGYNATHPFECGDAYEDHNYIGMRLACSLMGSLIVPCCFVSVWNLTASLTAAGLAAAFLICDTGLTTLSRYILLDPPLMMFISAAFCAMTCVKTAANRPFSAVWWGRLTMLGVALSCANAVKFVGLFVILLAGVFTLWQLWDVLGDPARPLAYTVRHFLARVLCLILLPVAMHMAFFYLHLVVVNQPGPGMSPFSSALQTTIPGTNLAEGAMPSEVAYGAQITLKSNRRRGGYLHSHPDLYPQGVGSIQQQQVTCYIGESEDPNHIFIIKRHDADAPDVDDPESPVDFVKSGDLVRLEHAYTKRNLHSHIEPAPLTPTNYQVTGYGNEGVGDDNDIWQVEIPGRPHGEVIKAVETRLVFYHSILGCLLTSTGKTLPKWGSDQDEVSCNSNYHQFDDRQHVWNVENIYYPKLPNATFSHLAPSFLSRFVELHRVMLDINAALKPKEGEVTSQPWEWPLDYQGQWFCSATKKRVYMLGNPIIFWTNLACLAFFPVLYAWDAFKERRKHMEPAKWKRARGTTVSACGWLFLGWFLHYAPFWCMGRVAYFHHYFPAFLFSCMLSAVIISYAALAFSAMLPELLSPVAYHTVIGGALAGAVCSFYIFSPLVYGMEGPPASDPSSAFRHLLWLESWQF